MLPMQRVQVRSLVGEPKIPHTRQWSQKKKRKKNCVVTNTTQKTIKACPRTTIYILSVNIPRWKNTVSVANWPPYREGKEKLRQEADHFRSVDGSFQKQDNLWMRLVLVGRKMNRYPQPVARILKSFHRTLSEVQSYIQSIWFNITVSRLNLKTAPAVGTVGRTYIPKAKVGVRTLEMPGSSSQANL